MLVEAVLIIIGIYILIIGSRREKRFYTAFGMILLSAGLLVFIYKYGFAISDTPISMIHRMECLTDMAFN